MSEKLIDDRYLGDGVYASFDGYHIWLDTRAQGTCKIALEPYVIAQFEQYKRDIVRAIEQAHAARSACSSLWRQREASVMRVPS